MKKRSKIILSMLLCMTFVLSFLPISAFADSTLLASGTCGDGVFWKFTNDGVLTVYGSGKINDYLPAADSSSDFYYSSAPWKDYTWAYNYDYDPTDGCFYDTDTGYALISRIIVKSGITGIGDGAFFDCGFAMNVSLPSTLKTIGDEAFSSCIMLDDIAVPSGVTAIGSYAFGNCVSNVNGDLPSKLTYLGDGAYFGNAIAETSVPSGIKVLPMAAFAYCESLTSVSLPDTLTEIGEFAFEKCSQLKEITIPKNVTNLDQNLFLSCGKLAKIFFTGNAPKFSAYSFDEVEATAYYPADKSGWTDDVLRSGYGGQINWAKWPLPAPANAKGVSSSSTSVKLTWDSVKGATGYAVYRSTAKDGTYSLLKRTSGTSLTNTSLKTNQYYYYKIRPYFFKDGSRSYGAYSSVVSVRPQTAAPTGVKAQSAGYDKIKLTWDSVDEATGYAVYRSTSKSGTYSYVGYTTKLSYTNGSRTTGKTYYYKVRSYTTVDGEKKYGQYSSVVSAKPVPAKPANVKAESAAYNKIRISWDAVDGATGYAVYRSTSKSGTYSYLASTTKTTMTNTSGLTTGSTYYYKVRAYRTVNDAKKYGTYSSVVSAKPLPSAPTGFTAKAGDGSVKLSWDAVTGATGYAVYRSTSKSGTYSYLSSTTKTTMTNKSGIQAGGSYYYKVRAYTTVDGAKKYGAYSSVAGVTMPSDENLTIKSVSVTYDNTLDYQTSSATVEVTLSNGSVLKDVIMGNMYDIPRLAESYYIVDLDGDGKKELIVNVGVYGSTYGAADTVIYALRSGKLVRILSGEVGPSISSYCYGGGAKPVQYNGSNAVEFCAGMNLGKSVLTYNGTSWKTVK